MDDIAWDGEASLYRVTRFATAPSQEQLVARDTLYGLVGAFLEMSPGQQEDLLIRIEREGDVAEYPAAEIRELAACPGYTGLAERDGTDRYAPELIGGFDETGEGSPPRPSDDYDARGRDGEK